MVNISFGEFFTKCKDRLTDEQLRALRTDIEYLEHENSYFGVKQDDYGVWVHIMVGDMRGIWAFRELVIRLNIPKIGCMCRPGSRTERIWRYYGAKMEKSGDFYKDGTEAIRCVIDTQQTRRLSRKLEMAL